LIFHLSQIKAETNRGKPMKLFTVVDRIPTPVLRRQELPLSTAAHDPKHRLDETPTSSPAEVATGRHSYMGTRTGLHASIDKILPPLPN
jgi:hypothetical protein